VSGRSLVQRNPIECGESQCDRKPSTMRRPWSTRGCCDMVKRYRIMFCERGGVVLCMVRYWRQESAQMYKLVVLQLS
jgi:hypothetical protein